MPIMWIVEWREWIKTNISHICRKFLLVLNWKCSAHCTCTPYAFCACIKTISHFIVFILFLLILYHFIFIFSFFLYNDIKFYLCAINEPHSHFPYKIPFNFFFLLLLIILYCTWRIKWRRQSREKKTILIWNTVHSSYINERLTKIS